MNTDPPPIPTPITDLPHLADAARRRGETHRVVNVDATPPPTIRTPGRTADQWLMSGEPITLPIPCPQCGWLRDGACQC
ncbi:hypothetical protein [Nocardia salmonicida]|uniref:hypothetical protein n=1 Tax=Nocardia salmonicida TaxID=53431 RepID=UPI0037B758F9